MQHSSSKMLIQRIDHAVQIRHHASTSRDQQRLAVQEQLCHCFSSTPGRGISYIVLITFNYIETNVCLQLLAL
jgi:glutamate mutase epsilon subunit